jgi:hypothetical protein
MRSWIFLPLWGQMPDRTGTWSHTTFILASYFLEVGTTKGVLREDSYELWIS